MICMDQDLFLRLERIMSAGGANRDKQMATAVREGTEACLSKARLLPYLPPPPPAAPSQASRLRPSTFNPDTLASYPNTKRETRNAKPQTLNPTLNPGFLHPMPCPLSSELGTQQPITARLWPRFAPFSVRKSFGSGPKRSSPITSPLTLETLSRFPIPLIHDP